MASVLKRFFPVALMFAALLLPACVPHGAGARGAAAERSAAERFYFVQISDTHFVDRDHLERTRRRAEQINLPRD